MYQGSQYRDTDWYEAHASGGAVTMQAVAEFPLQLILIYGTNCSNPQYDIAQADRCEEGELSHIMGPGALVWLWIGPSVFEGVPESDYVMTVCGIEPNPVAAVPTSWGRLKTRFSEKP